MRGHAVMGEQGVQKGAEHAPLWGPCVEMLFPTFTTWGQPIRMSRTQLHRAGFRARVLLEGIMVLNAEL